MAAADSAGSGAAPARSGGLYATLCFCCPQGGKKKVVLARRGLVTDPKDFRNQVQGVRRIYPDFTDMGKMRKVKFFMKDGKKRYYVDDPQEGRLYLTKDKRGNRAYYVDSDIEVLGCMHTMIFITWDEDGNKLYYVEDKDLGKVFIEEDPFGGPQFWVHDLADDLAPIVFVLLDKALGHVNYFSHPVAVSDEVYFNSGFQRTGVFQIFWGNRGDKRFYVSDENPMADNLRRVVFDDNIQQWRFYKPIDYQVESDSSEDEDAPKADQATSNTNAAGFARQGTLASSGSMVFDNAAFDVDAQEAEDAKK